MFDNGPDDDQGRDQDQGVVHNIVDDVHVSISFTCDSPPGR